MALKPEDITRIERLARIELTPQEGERMLTQINSFFELVEQINAVDTNDVEPLAHPVELLTHIQLRLRQDVVSEIDARTANQQSAPAVEKGLFLVPRVVE
jgi:aspartyl-tRNA(Asn)/glutamyl-tRNA(Gln) amidotransferase subunit C